MSELTELKTQRASTKGCLTRIKNLIEQKGDTLTPVELECRLGILESYFKQVLSYQTSIEKLQPDDASEAKVRSELEELYCAAKSKILSLSSGVRKASIPSDTNGQFVVASSSLNHLPKLKLPQFSGKYSEFSNFWGCFDKLIHSDASLSNLEKFNHLLSCLSGQALRSIKAFEVTEENYSKALDHLKARYNNKYLIFQEHIVELFNQPKVARNSSAQLRNLLDNTSAHLNALLSLGNYENITNAFIIYLVNSKLDSDSQSLWEAGLDFKDLPTWDKCSEILSRRCQYLESKDAKSNDSSSNNSFRKGKPNRNHNTHATSLATTQSACGFCGQNDHTIYNCQAFLGLTVQDRFKEVKARSLCVNCLFKGHTVKKCSVKRCRVCSMPHHTLLHRYRTISVNTSSSGNDSRILNSLVAERDQSVNVGSNKVSSTGNISLQTLHKHGEEKDHVFLATALVRVKDRFGTLHFARALLDSASQLNFMTERLAQVLKLPRARVEAHISGIGDTTSKVQYYTNANIQSYMSDFGVSLQTFILPTITGAQPEKKIIVDHWDIPDNIKLADPRFFEPQAVDILIGADYFFQLLCVGQIRLGGNLPTLQKTRLGWIVSGRCSNAKMNHRDYAYSLLCDNAEISVNPEAVDQSLNRLVEKLWEEDDVSSCSRYTEEQLQCEASFKGSLKQLPDGRFIVKLPFKEGCQKLLGNSFETAKRRFLYLEKRLMKNPEVKVQYSQFLKEYLEAGHMELITAADIPALHYFLPHQYVIRPDSSTTKLRVVFDASCRTSSNISLNDVLLVGPVVQDDLFAIVLRFRCYRYALTADISAMYRQILIYPEDRNFQLILWRERPEDEFCIYRLNTVTYGMSCSPYLPTGCITRLGEKVLSTKPDISRIITRDFYMDDLITGANTVSELREIKKEVDSTLKSGQFHLRKWYSNDGDFLTDVPENDRGKTLRINDSDIIKALGIIWEPTSDRFLFDYKKGDKATSKITKRMVLSKIASLFDPLGLVNPVVSKAKIFLQELWNSKLNWDESLPMELENR